MTVTQTTCGCKYPSFVVTPQNAGKNAPEIIIPAAHNKSPLFLCFLSNFREPGSEWALNAAKYNLVTHYLVVGLTEDMAHFVAVLEATLPRFFRGATELYNSGQYSFKIHIIMLSFLLRRMRYAVKVTVRLSSC